MKSFFIETVRDFMKTQYCRDQWNQIDYSIASKFKMLQKAKIVNLIDEEAEENEDDDDDEDAGDEDEEKELAWDEFEGKVDWCSYMENGGMSYRHRWTYEGVDLGYDFRPECSASIIVEIKEHSAIA
jgi:hypothetical protein